jgi:methionine-rich copper-binding protein CopC
MKKMVLLMLLGASPAFAHAKLVASEPAAGAKIHSPKLIRLLFSEDLEPAFSGASLIDAGGKTIQAASAVATRQIGLVPFTLKPGRYTVTWHSVGHDTHRITGTFSFEVVP